MIRRIRFVSRRDVEAEDPGRPARRQQQRRQDLDERRLARAVGPEQPEELAGRDLEVDAVERDDRLGLGVVDAADAACVDGERAGPDGHTGPREGAVGRTGRIPPRPGATRCRSRAAVGCGRTPGCRAGPRSRRPTRASFTMSAVFARTDAPSVSSATRPSSHGVSAGPRCPPPRPRGSPARPRRGPRRGRGPRAPAPGRRAGSTPPSPGRGARPTSAAAAATSGTDAGAAMPAERA